MPGSKIQKLCGCGRPTRIKQKAKDGTYRYESNCYVCRYESQKHRKSYCEKCGGTDKLEIDHIDADRSNNKVDNLQTLCDKCHIEKTKLNKDWMRKMKHCSVCKEEKSYENFHKSAKTADGYTFRCKSCQSAYYKGYNASRKAAQQQVEVQSKVCRECGLEKPISQFGIKATSLDKHNIYCKPCWRIRCYESMRRNAR